MTTESALKEFHESLDAGLLAYLRYGDAGPIIQHLEKYSPELKGASELTKKVGFMKTATARTTLPIELRRKAKQWLDERGMSSLDDGDL